MPTLPPAAREPQGFMVRADESTRVHFLDWGAAEAGPAGAPEAARATEPGVVLLHGLAGTAWAWAPVARRLAATHRVIAPDLRGHGLSDAPPDGYDPETLAADALAVAEGADLLTAPDGVAAPGEFAAPGLILVGHGFGAIVAATAAARLGERCAGLVLVDGGWEDAESATGLEPAELLRGLEEPPEVLRSLNRYLADRRDFDPASWDADQERAARAAIVELPAGRVVPSARAHALAGCVDAMYAYRPHSTLVAVTAPIVALVAMDDEAGTHRRLLARAQDALAAAGRPAMTVIDLPSVAHNLARYAPDVVAEAIATVARLSATVGHAPAAYHPGS